MLHIELDMKIHMVLDVDIHSKSILHVESHIKLHMSEFENLIVKGGGHIPSDATHARSEATRFEAANCKYHRLQTAHNTD